MTLQSGKTLDDVASLTEEEQRGLFVLFQRSSVVLEQAYYAEMRGAEVEQLLLEIAKLFEAIGVLFDFRPNIGKTVKKRKGKSGGK